MTKKVRIAVLLVSIAVLLSVVWAVIAVRTYEEVPVDWDQPPYATIDGKTYRVSSYVPTLPNGYVEFGTLSAEAASTSNHPEGAPLYRNEAQPGHLYVLDKDRGRYTHLEDQRLSYKALYYEGEWYFPDHAQYIPSDQRHEIPRYRKSDCTPTGDFTFRTSGIPTTSGAVNVRDWEGGQILLYNPDPRFLFLMVGDTPTMYYPFASADFCGLDYSDLLQS